jgi:hypothetical protein
MTPSDALAMLRRKGYILVDDLGTVIEGSVLPVPVELPLPLKFDRFATVCFAMPFSGACVVLFCF